MAGHEVVRVRIEPWKDDDLALLYLSNTAEMTDHLGGPESDEQVRARHQRYLDLNAAPTGQMFSIVLEPEDVPVGAIGYWEREWRGDEVYETGWSVHPPFQGRGIAVAAATAVVAEAAAASGHRHVHAFPSVDHPASNAICRKAGFELVGEFGFEYPPGRVMRCNDWRYDLASFQAS